jgi:hypothetical protein
LQSLSGYAPDHLIVFEILSQVSHLHKAGKFVVLCWIPSHSSVLGSDAANASDKSSALHGPLASNGDLGSDVRAFLYRTVLSSWQD